MYLNRKILDGIINDNAKIDKFIKLNNNIEDLGNDLFNFFYEFFEDYSYNCQYDEAYLKSLQNRFDKLLSKWETFIGTLD